MVLFMNFIPRPSNSRCLGTLLAPKEVWAFGGSFSGGLGIGRVEKTWIF